MSQLQKTAVTTTHATSSDSFPVLPTQNRSLRKNLAGKLQNVTSGGAQRALRLQQPRPLEGSGIYLHPERAEAAVMQLGATALELRQSGVTLNIRMLCRPGIVRRWDCGRQAAKGSVRPTLSR